MCNPRADVSIGAGERDLGLLDIVHGYYFLGLVARSMVIFQILASWNRIAYSIDRGYFYQNGMWLVLVRVG